MHSQIDPKHYPMSNEDFEMYKIETVTEGSSSKEVLQIGMSDWLRRNMKRGVQSTGHPIQFFLFFIFYF
jgi:hypothetical protein